MGTVKYTPMLCSPQISLFVLPKFLSFLSKPNETEWKIDKEKWSSCSEMAGQCKSGSLS